MHNFLLEKRLREAAPDLHRRAKGSAFALQKMLDSYLSWFPTFTDHSMLHSMEVLDYCNRLLGDKVCELTPQECYVLIMSCYLHDAGMGVSKEHFASIAKMFDLSEYRKAHPMADTPQSDLHNEFSGLFIRRYAVFDEAEYLNLETEDGVKDAVGLALDSVSVSTDVLERDTIIFPKFHREKCIGCGR